MLGLLYAQFDTKIGPDRGFIGSGAAEQIMAGIMFYALIFCLVGLVLSAGLWAVGAFSNNYTQSVNGKKGFLICAGGALAIGAAQAIVTFFFNIGVSVEDTRTTTVPPGGDLNE